MLPEFFNNGLQNVIIGIGDIVSQNKKREYLYNKLKNIGFELINIIDQASRINPQDFDLNNEKFDYKCLNNNYQDNNEFDSEMLEEKSKYRAKKRDLEELKDLFEANLINEDDYDKAKRKVLNL